MGERKKGARAAGHGERKRSSLSSMGRRNSRRRPWEEERSCLRGISRHRLRVSPKLAAYLAPPPPWKNHVADHGEEEKELAGTGHVGEEEELAPSAMVRGRGRRASAGGLAGLVTSPQQLRRGISHRGC
ncbi:unnamed protein product [Urochloa humidicola]